MPAVNDRSKMFLQTTEVSAAKSIGEIVAVLVKFGARSIETLYEAGKPVGLSWSMELYRRLVYFRMPAKVDPVLVRLRQSRAGYVNSSRLAQMREQAERIAWRQMLAWVKVQMSLIELGMVEYAEVFLPYVTGGEGRTMWETAREFHFKALPPPQ